MRHLPRALRSKFAPQMLLLITDEQPKRKIHQTRTQYRRTVLGSTQFCGGTKQVGEVYLQTVTGRWHEIPRHRLPEAVTVQPPTACTGDETRSPSRIRGR